MPILTINKSNFLQGMSLSDFSGDKGFSPLSKGFEVDRRSSLGLLTPGRALTEYSTNINGNIIAKTKYKASADVFSYYAITTTGRVIQTNATTVAHVVKDTITGKTFTAGISSCLAYLDGLYITSADDIYFDNFSFTAPDKTWWTTTKGKAALITGVPHKLFEFNGVMFILNGNKIASWDGTTAKDDAFTWGTIYEYSNTQYTTCSVRKVSDSKAILLNPELKNVGTLAISGTTITSNSDAADYESGYMPGGSADYLGNDYFQISFRDGGDSGKGKSIIGYGVAPVVANTSAFFQLF